MSAEWIASRTVRLVVGHVTDPRPVWFWSEDGDTLIWSNAAAMAVGAKPGGQPATPIGGQVARAIRLGIKGRPSLSRMQFEAGRKPLSLTCTCTPLPLRDKGLGLLIVGVDPLDPETVAGRPAEGTGLAGLFGSEIAYTLLDAEGNAIAGRGEPQPAERQDIPAGPDGALVQLAAPAEAHAAQTLDPGDVSAQEKVAQDAPEPEIGNLGEADDQRDPQGDEELAESNERGDVDVGRADEHGSRSLSQLFDQLASSDELFTPLDARDDAFDPHVVEASAVSDEDDTLEQPGEALASEEGEGEPAPAPEDELDAEAEARNDAFLTAVEAAVREEADAANAASAEGQETGAGVETDAAAKSGAEKLAAELLAAGQPAATGQETQEQPESQGRQEPSPQAEDERQILWRLVSDGYFPDGAKDRPEPEAERRKTGTQAGNAIWQ